MQSNGTLWSSTVTHTHMITGQQTTTHSSTLKQLQECSSRGLQRAALTPHTQTMTQWGLQSGAQQTSG